MAKLKNKITSKYKYQVKRKLVLGGPEQELYLNNNTTYQAQTPPTAMLQQQFDAQEQEKAKRMSAIYGNQVARELDYLQDINKSEVERKQEEQKQRDATAAANAQQVQTTATKDIGTTGLTTGLQAAKSAYQIQQTTNAAMAAAKPTVQYSSQIGTWAGSGPSSPIVQSAAKSGLQAGAKAVGSAALIAAPQIVGLVASNQLNKADDKQIKAQDKSQYYDDTDYSRKEYNAQLLKSAGKGATIGGTIASAIPIPGVSTGIGMAAGALIGTGVGAIKAQHQRRMTKTEDERGFKIGNKKFGEKLLFGEENVYSASKDPNEIAKKEYEKALKNQEELSAQLSNQFLSSRLQSDTNTGFNVAKYGGAIKKLKGGVAKPIGKGAVEYIGKKHEHGGIDLPGNIEVEGGETEQNNYIFSATLKLPNGATYAQAHKALVKSGATGEEIHQLALSQEAAAGRNPNEIKSMKFAKYGGPLMYVNGGPTDPDKKEPDPEFLKEKGFVKQDNGEYQTFDADKNLITYDPKTKEYRYITTKKVNTPDGWRMGAAINFSNYDDINKIKTELDAFNKKDFNNNQLYEFNANLEKKYLGKTSTEKTNETEKLKTTTTTNVDATAYKPPVTTQSPNVVTTNPPVTTTTTNSPAETTINPPAVTANTTAIDRNKLTFGSDNLENDIVTEVTDPKTGEKIQLNTGPRSSWDPSIVPDFNTKSNSLTNKKSTVDLPTPPTYTRTKSTNNLGLIQTIPAAIALTNNIKTRDITPSLTTNYVQPGSIGQINLGRVSMSAEKAANQQNQAAITQALQNMSGPGAIAGMVAAKTKADQQALQIAQAEQNINMGRAGEEAKINAGISQFNVGQSMAAQQARANIDQANAARMQQAMQFNTQLKYARDVENREQRLAAADRAAQAITINALANRQLDVTENLANVQDYTNAYKRYLEQMDKQQATQAKFGGAKKYISRLGDLKNVKYKV